MTLEKKFDLEQHKITRELVTWGTLGPKQDYKKHKIKLVSELSTPHIVAIRLTQHQISNNMKKVLADEIIYRDLFPEANIND